MQRACGHYRVNTAATTFGDCLCGWSKAAHGPEAFVTLGASKKRAVRKSAELRSKMIKKEKCACDRYVVNTNALNFGECVCGAARAEHSEAALAAGEQAKGAIVDAAAVRARMVQRAHAECIEYRPDMMAATFGTCVCGRPRAEHSDAALSACVDKRKGHGTTRQDSGEVRAKFVQRTYVACEKYELQMGGSIYNMTAFGTCVCGAPRAEHSPAALEAASAEKAEPRRKRASAEVRKGFAQTAAWDERECCECESFELDLDPAAPFGMCVCGEPKARHADAAMVRETGR